MNKIKIFKTLSSKLLEGHKTPRKWIKTYFKEQKSWPAAQSKFCLIFLDRNARLYGTWMSPNSKFHDIEMLF